MNTLPEIGSQFGRWTVIDNRQRAGGQKRPACLCRCKCGNTGIVSNSDLRIGRSKSCGCMRVDCSKQRSKSNSQGYSATRLYNIWSKMRGRCYNPEYPYYKDYHDRGISICDEWRTDFMAFRKWALTHGYREDLSIDRIDNDKGYSPDNCRWATSEEQQNNTRRNLNLTLGNKTQSLSRWARELNMPTSTIYGRLDRGWSVEKALTYPIDKRMSTRKKAIV